MTVIVGEKEVMEETVSVRHNGEDKGSMTVNEFIAKFNEAVKAEFQ